MIKNFAPAKANLKTGLLLESHILERNKCGIFNPDIREEEIRQGTAITGRGNSITGSSIISHNAFPIDSRGREKMQGTNGLIYVVKTEETGSVGFDLSTNPLYGDVQEARISKKYYYQVLPYNRYYHQTSISQSIQLS